MRQFLFSLAVFFTITVAHGQAVNWEWARGISGTSSDEGWSICTDTAGNTYATGYFSSPTLTFGSTVLTNAGVHDIFLVKYDANGNVIWAKSAGGTHDDWGNSVCVDRTGNIFVAGFFQNTTIAFGTTVLTNSSAGTPDIFLVKYDANGNVIWARSAGGAGQDIAKSISADASGNVYMTGNFSSPTIVFGAYTLINNGYLDAFLVKYDSNGNVAWATNPNCTFYDEGSGVATDASGNVFVTGYFQNVSISFGSNTLANTGGSDPFIVKYDSSGNVIWAKSITGTASDVGNALTTDIGGNVYITGYFYSSTITIGSYSLTNSSGYSYAYVAKYNAAGNVLWAKAAGSTSPAYGWCIYADSKGKIYVTGGFYSPSITFSPYTLTRPAGSCDPLYLVQYDSLGRVTCAAALPSGGDDNCAISADTSGNVYLCGDYFCSPFVIGSDTFLLSGPSMENIFIAKCTFNCLDVGIDELSNNQKIIIYPNPSTGNFTIHGLTNGSLNVCNVLGEEVYSEVLKDDDVQLNLAPGVYFVRIETGEKVYTQTLMIE